MPTTFECVDRPVIRQVTFYQLEAGCDRLPLAAAGDTTIFNAQQMITRYGRKRNYSHDTIDDLRTVDGGTCPDTTGCAIDNGTTHGFSWCREPYPLQVLAGLESVFRSVANVAVSGAEEVAGCLRNFAALITLGPPDGTCPTGTAQCRSFFISKLTQFNSADEKAWENQSVSKMTTAWTSRPNANILQNYASYAALPLTIRNAFPATEFALLQSGKPSVWADNACPPALVNSPCQIGPIA